MKNFFLTFVILLFAGFSTFGQIPTNGLIAWYPFNGNANDASGNGYNGTNYGATLTSDRFGNSNQAYYFNGINNYINTNLMNVFSNTMTLAVWFKTSIANNGSGLLTSRNDYANFSGLAIWDYGYISFNAKYLGAIYASNNYLDDNWHFAAGTYDGSVQKIYVDGILITQSLKSGEIDDAIRYLIGFDECTVCPQDRHFNGKIDDIRIYNRALNSSEIQQLYLENVSTCPISVSHAGKTYSTVQIGLQCWIKENLNVGNKVNANLNQTNNGIIEKYCYDNLESNCNIYGGFYQWDEMMQYALTSGAQGICPTGWHLPADQEWCSMTKYLDPTIDCINPGWTGTDAGSKMKSTSGWYNSGNGTNASGFSVLPAGYRHYDGTFMWQNYSANFWSSTQDLLTKAYDRACWHGYANVGRYLNNYKTYAYSVRCLKDSGNAGKATVSTSSASNITNISVLSGGIVISEGGSPVTERGVCWSTSPNPSLNDYHISNGTGAGTFTCTISNLAQNLTYYAKAYAINSAGTAYGNTINFTTANTFGLPCPTMPTITDTRNGKVYNTIKIGNQCWMKESLNIGTRISSSQNQTNNNTIEKYCYNNNESYCNTYGGLYQWNEAMQYSTTPGVQGICPTGWHLPADAEWCTMTVLIDSTVSCSSQSTSGTNVGGKMKEAGNSHWLSPNVGATNESSFTGLPHGRRLSDGTFYGLGTYGNFWTSSSYSSTQFWGRLLHTDHQLVYRYNYNNSNGFSVRCIKDNDVTSLSVDFDFVPLQPVAGKQVQFTSSASSSSSIASWEWNFGDFAVSTEPNPVHTYTSIGPMTVTLTMKNSAGVTSTKTKTVTVGSNNNGIDLEIVETGGTDTIDKVGYYYKYCIGNDIIKTELKIFPVQINNGKKIVGINNFINQETFNTNNQRLISDFCDVIYFFDEAMNQLGHISFQYEHSKEKEFVRNAIVFFHNDTAMCGSGNKFYPYNSTNSLNPFTKEWRGLKWRYFKDGEYPVSMLIPPENSFVNSYDKQPLLFVHGLNGTYSLLDLPNADLTKNQVSYWFTTVHLVNTKNYHGWQLYYPYDSDILHITYCLKNAISNLYDKYNQSPNNFKIGIVTHSMGGLVTLKYLISNPFLSYKIKKIMLFQPPVHGSLGGNHLYKKNTIDALAAVLIFGSDRLAPALQDLSITSDFQRELILAPWQNALDFNNNNNIEDDCFVVLGSTPIKSATDVQLSIKGLFAEEAYQHNDALVSISSGSLLDKNLGFATIYGNHDDGRHAQSNIGNPNLLPDIIDIYFTYPYQSFINSLKSDDFPDIKSIIVPSGIIKPQGATLANLNKPSHETGEENVIYQKGILSLQMDKINSIAQDKNYYSMYYNSAIKQLELYPISFISFLNKPDDLFSKQITKRGYLYRGVFRRNFETNRFYPDSQGPDFVPPIDRGCAVRLEQDTNKLIVMNSDLKSVIGDYTTTFSFSYCKTHFITLGQNAQKSPIDSTNSITNSKQDSIIPVGQSAAHNPATSFYIDNQAILVKFQLSSSLASDKQIPLIVKMRKPDGAICDSNYSGGTYSNGLISGVYEYRIPNPQVGKWTIWAESNYPGADTIEYSAVAYLMSDVYEYLINDTVNANVGTEYLISAGLQMDTLSLADSLVTIATVTKPNGDTVVFDLTSSKTAIDSAYRFTHALMVDTIGYYYIKISMDGVYDNYRFERVIFHQFEAKDTTIHLSLPNVILRQSLITTEVDLRNYAYDYTCSYDSLHFTATVINSGLATSTITYSLNDTTNTLLLYSNLADTGTMKLRVVMYMPGKSVADTMLVTVGLPDLWLYDNTANKTIVYPDSTLIVNCKIKNIGNLSSNAFRLNYFLSRDNILDPSDIPIGDRNMSYLVKDSIIHRIDTLTIPSVTGNGSWNLLCKADALNEIKEKNDSTNNLGILPITVNRLNVITLKLYIEGLYNGSGIMNKAQDTSGSKYFGDIADKVSIKLVQTTSPYNVLATFNNVSINTNGICSVTIPQTMNGTYYVAICHRNSLETWSSQPVNVNSPMVTYDFSDASSKALGNNMKLKGSVYMIYSGDANQDGIIDLFDMVPVDNARHRNAQGYIYEDINGDGIINAADLIFIETNAAGFIKKQTLP